MREEDSFSWFPSLYLGRPDHLSLLMEAATQSQPGYEVVWSLQLNLCHISSPQWTFQRYLFTCVSDPEQLRNFS